MRGGLVMPHRHGRTHLATFERRYQPLIEALREIARARAEDERLLGPERGE